MRLWTLHPSLLDRRGLGACWSEGLLAQKVLAGETRGWRHHPQLDRFRSDQALIGAYLREVQEEGTARGYRYRAALIRDQGEPSGKIEATEEQLQAEWRLLLEKVKERDPSWYGQIRGIRPWPHPLFVTRPSASWSMRPARHRGP